MTGVETRPRSLRDPRGPKRGFWYGVALIFDFTGSLSRRSPQLPDSDLLARDGQAIAQDYRRAVRKTAPTLNREAAAVGDALVGPWPSPGVLASLARTEPDLIDQLIKNAREERDRKHQLDRHDVTSEWLGLCTGFVVAVLGLLVSTLLVLEGHDWAGVALGSVVLVSLAAVLVIVGHVTHRDGGKPI